MKSAFSIRKRQTSSASTLSNKRNADDTPAFAGDVMRQSTFKAVARKKRKGNKPMDNETASYILSVLKNNEMSRHSHMLLCEDMLMDRINGRDFSISMKRAKEKFASAKDKYEKSVAAREAFEEFMKEGEL